MKCFHAIVLFLFTVISVSTSLAEELRVLTGNAVQGPQKVLAEKFMALTGHSVIIFSSNPSVIQQKLDAKDLFELYVIPAALLKVQYNAGKLQSDSLRPLAKIGVGIAARENGPKPDTSSPEAFKASLMAAKAITYSDAATGGLSAVSVARVLANMGLTEAIKPKVVLSTNGQDLVASGEVDFGLFNASEIPRAKGVVLAGRVPAMLQATLDYDVGIPITNSNPILAKSFIAYMISEDARAIWEEAHIDQAK